MKCSSRRNCDAGRLFDLVQLVAHASMKCSSRRNCDLLPTRQVTLL